MTVTVVSPVVIPFGGSVHLTPTDQNGAPIPISQCTLINVPSALATVSYDATGAILTAVAAGQVTTGQWKATDGITTVTSGYFTVKVTAAPYAVTAVGDTLP